MSAETLQIKDTSPDRSPNPTPNFLFPSRDAIDNFFDLTLAITQLQLAAGELGVETTSAALSMVAFYSLERSRDPADRALFRGDHVNTNHRIILAPGFEPPPEFLWEAAENRLLKPYEKLTNGTFFGFGLQPFRAMRQQYLESLAGLTQYKSRDMLEGFKSWLERMGNTVSYGLESPNTLQTENLLELTERTEDLAGDGSVIGIGHSAGGEFIELVADYLYKKHGRPVINTIIKIGSPEITPKMLDRFEELAIHDGLGGLVHEAAKRCMDKDPLRGADGRFSQVQQYLLEYANRGINPMLKEVIYYSKGDIIVPKPERSGAIEVGGPHSTLMYQKRLLEHLSTRVLSTPNSRAFLRAA